MKKTGNAGVIGLIVLILILLPLVLADHKPSHNPGGGGSGGGGTTETSTTSPSGGGAGVQNIVGIYPQFPLDEETIKNGENNIAVKITYGGSPSSSARVTLESELFETTNLKYTRGITGIYEGNVTIKNKPKGKYKLVYRVEDKEKEVGGIFVILDPELRIGASLKDSYMKGERILFEGEVRDFNNELQLGVDIIIKGDFNGQLFEKNLTTDVAGRFSEEYLISQADPSNKWNITIEAKDESGNYGIKSFFPEVKASGVAQYAVNFMSPLTDSTFKRGESIPVTVQIKESDALVEGAKVAFFSPKGNVVEMKEVDKGIYSTNYVIRNDDPVGGIRLKVEASKTIKEGIIKVGGDSLTVKISPVEMNFDIDSPSSDIIYTNSRVNFKLKLSYFDGSLVEGALVEVLLSNGNIVGLSESKRGIYIGDYLPKTEDKGVLQLKLSATDNKGNIGSTELTLFVRKRSFIGNILAFILDIAKQYLWAILAFLIAAALVYKPSFEISWIERKIQKLIEEQKNLKAMQMETERKYYKEGSITKKEFRDLMEKYEERLAKANENEKIYKKGLIEKLERIKKKKVKGKLIAQFKSYLNKK